jgi:hypothetical protein
MMTQQQIPFYKAILWIAASLLLISVPLGSVGYYYRYVYLKQKQLARYKIVAIAQKSNDSDALPTSYLAELLELSYDRPTNLYHFDTDQAEAKLLNSPLIRSVKVHAIKPGTVYVEYSLRKPIALWGDFTNTALDAEGTPFPLAPFFSPKKLPEIYLGKDYSGQPVEWGKPLAGTHINLALEVHKALQELPGLIEILRIDVSRAFALSYGQRQIIVMLQQIKRDGIYPRTLRFSTNGYKQEIARAVLLLKHSKVPKIAALIDLRVPQLAFIQTEAN